MHETPRIFDADRTGTGTAEWAEVTENICRGCANNCLYCYAAHNANRFNQRPRADWAREEMTKRAAMTSYPARGGVIMFPSSHDITPFNVVRYLEIAKLILEKGNRLLIVTKPRMDCVERLFVHLSPWKDQILFRATIGTVVDEVSKLWEPGAPLPAERIAALSCASALGFNTSVSIEPMLEGYPGTVAVVDAVRPYGPQTVWIGKMNKPKLRVSAEYAADIARIEDLQRDEEILALVRHYEGDPIIRWKDSIKEVIARLQHP